MGALGSSLPWAVMGSLSEACSWQFNCYLDQVRPEVPGTLFPSEVQGCEPVPGHHSAHSPGPPGPDRPKEQLG